MEKETVKNAYLAFRYLELLCVAVFILGLLWTGTEKLDLTFPEFMMLYGGTGAIVSEALARILHKQVKKNVSKKEKKVEVKNGSQSQ